MNCSGQLRWLCGVVSLLLLVVFVGLVPPVQAQNPAYLFNQYTLPYQNIGYYEYGFALASGDFNKDGRADFAVTLATSPTVPYGIQILLGQKDGTVALGGLYTVSNDILENVVTADFNRDGNLDLVAFDVTASNYVLFAGNGNGTFQSATVIAPGYYDTALVVADLNHDGKLDLLTGEYYGGVMQIVLGNGDGTFQPPVQYTAGGGGVDSIAVADVNKDGKLDVVAVALNGGPEVFLGNGDGTLQTPTALVTNSPYPYSVAIADMNNDGKQDLVIGEAGSIDVFLGNGDGTFGAPIQSFGGAASYYLTNLAIADLNGDKKMDVVGGGAYSITVWMGNGNGTFKTERSFGSGYFGEQGFNSMLVADYNNDGKLDVATLPENATLFSIFSGNGDGTFAAGRIVTSALANSYRGAVAGDFNKDNKYDFAVVNDATNNLEVYLGNGTGTFSTAKKFPVGASPQQIVAADFNNDGNLDLAVTNAGENTVSLLLGSGNGLFQTQQKFATGSYPYGIAAADVNKDGNMDLVIGTSDAPTNVQVLLGNGNGTFQPATSWGIYGGGVNTTLAVADINQDGYLDIASSTGDPYGGFSVLFGAGDGTFANGVQTDTYANGEYAMGAAQLQPGGFVDVIFGTPDGLEVVPSTNLGITGSGAFYELGPCIPVAVVVADFNGDGNLDVASTCEMGTIVWLGKGDGTFNSVLVYASSGFLDYSYGLAAADFNSDGLPDLVTTHVSGNITTLLSNPVVVFSVSKLNFGKVTVGSPVSKSFTLLNQGQPKLTISSISLTGQAPTDFTETSNCPLSPSSLAVGGMCKVTITFTPSTTGARNASIVFSDSAIGPARMIALSGTGQ